MDIDKKIEELRKEFNNKIDQLKEDYKNELKEKEKSEKWIPKENEVYYYVNMSYLNVDGNGWYNDRKDNTIIKYNKIFKTKEDAQEYADYLKARCEYSYEFSKEEWEDSGIQKYFIYYNHTCNVLGITANNIWFPMNGIHFKSRGKAEEFLDKYKKQILKFEFGIEEE